MRNLESLRSLNKKTGVFKNVLDFQPAKSPTVANQPDLPVVSPEDIFVKQRTTDPKLFPENRHITKPELRILQNAEMITIEEDLSVKKLPTIPKPLEVTIFTAPVKRLTNILLGQNS